MFPGKVFSIHLLLGVMLLLVLNAMAQGTDQYEDVDEEEEIDALAIYTDKLPWAKDLVAEARKAACKGQPLVIMFGSSTCPYCSVVRSLYVAPLEEDDRYPGIVVREIETDSPSEVRDFKGRLSTMSEISSAYGIYLVPTVIVFTADGEQVGKPLIGLSTEDFYGAYLDVAIRTGAEAVMQKSSGGPSALPAGYACD